MGKGCTVLGIGGCVTPKDQWVLPLLSFRYRIGTFERMSFTLAAAFDGSVWTIERLGDAWVALYRFEAQDGYPALAELRVIPTPDFDAHLAQRFEQAGGLPEGVELSDLNSASQDAWRDVIRGELPPGTAPAGGLTARRLRSGLHVGEAQEQARRLLEIVGRKVTWARDPDAPRGLGLAGGTWSSLGYRPEAVQEPRRPGRRGHGDLYYIEYAARYVAALDRGSSKAVAEVAEELSRDGRPHTAEYIRDVIHQARRRGLLTHAPPGRPGGQLTDKAHAVLEAASV